MGEKPLLGRIVWAIDAFAEGDVQKRSVEVLRALTSGARAVIDPVYVLTPAQLNLTAEFYPGWESLYRPIADRIMASLERESGLEGLGAPKIIADNHASTRRSVDLLIEYAHDQEADLIVASTHARTGAARFLLGSFAETLILHSRIPVLVANPAAVPAGRIEQILFATDFSDASRTGFESLLPFAKRLGASVTIYYKALTPTSVGFPRAPSLQAYAAREFETALDRGNKWADWAHKRGTLCRVVVDEGEFGVAHSIVKAAEGGPYQLIAMVARTGPAASVLVGSITREVVRAASRPVWILRQPH